MKTFVFSAVALLLLGCAQKSAAPGVRDFNQITLEILKTYPVDGTHGYWWPRAGESDYDGCSQDLYFLGEKVMEGEPQRRTYCCGLTLEVFLRAYNAWLEQNGGAAAAKLKPSDWPEFQRLWFVENLNGPGPSAALEKFHLGRKIAPEEARPGDYIQLWRTPDEKGKCTGHSVIFLDWTRDSQGQITGIRYWSTQPGTKGISEREEFFGPNGGLSQENTHFARVEPGS